MSDVAAAQADAHPAPRVIYDFGMNNGDDIEYYLKKADRGVGVDANRTLCDEVCRRFADESEQGRLTVLPIALSDRGTDDLVTFYLHKGDSVASQLPRPGDDEIEQFEAAQVPARTASSIVLEYGSPLYIKIDVEHFDHFVLSDLFSAKVFPPFISAEAHSVEVFALLVANGYSGFALIDGATVGRRYADSTILTEQGEEKFSFKPHSAGPFGEDIDGPWEDADTFFYRLASEGLGWKDVHASRIMPVAPPPSSAEIARRQTMALARKFLGRLHIG